MASTLTKSNLYVVRTITNLRSRTSRFYAVLLVFSRKYPSCEKTFFVEKRSKLYVFVYKLESHDCVPTEDQKLVVMQEKSALLELRESSHQLQNFKNRNRLQDMKARGGLGLLDAREVEKMLVKLSKFLCVWPL